MGVIQIFRRSPAAIASVLLLNALVGSTVAEDQDERSNVLATLDAPGMEHSLVVNADIDRKPARIGICSHSFSQFRSRPRNADEPRLLKDPADEAEDAKMEFRRAPEVLLGGHRVHFPLGEVPYRRLSPAEDPWHDCDGAIGLDALQKSIVQLDFDSHAVRILKFVPADAGKAIPILSLNGPTKYCCISVHCAIGNEAPEEFLVMLDRSESLYVRSDLFRRLVEDKTISRFHEESRLYPGAYETDDVGIIRGTFSVGDFQTNGERVLLDRENMIGLQYLSRYLVTFDFAAGIMYLKPGKQFHRIDGIDVSGLELGWKQGKLEILAVRRRSAAYNAGLEVGDVITQVGDVRADRSQTAAIKKLLQGEDQTIKVKRLRGTTESVVEMTLTAWQMLFPYEQTLVPDLKPPRIPDFPRFPPPLKLPRAYSPMPPTTRRT